MRREIREAWIEKNDCKSWQRIWTCKKWGYPMWVFFDNRGCTLYGKLNLVTEFPVDYQRGRKKNWNLYDEVFDFGNSFFHCSSRCRSPGAWPWFRQRDESRRQYSWILPWKTSPETNRGRGIIIRVTPSVISNQKLFCSHPPRPSSLHN